MTNINEINHETYKVGADCKNENFQTFIVVYGNIGAKVKRKDLEDLYLSFITTAYNKIGKDPDRIIFPSGLEITYHCYVFHQCFDHGSISENELMEMLMVESLN